MRSDGGGDAGGLIRAGFDACGFDIHPDCGPLVTTDPDAFATDLQTLITVVRDADQTDALLFDTQGLIDRHQPLFGAMGQSFHRMGPYGAGMQAKVLNNLLAASHTAMTRLVLDWADTAGIDEAALLALIATSSGQNWFASGFATIEFAHDGHASDNSIGILVKDIAAALDTAPTRADQSLPLAVQAALQHLKPRRSD